LAISRRRRRRGRRHLLICLPDTFLMLLWLLPGPLAWDLTTLAITTTTTTTAAAATTTKRRQRLLAICFELDIRLYLRTSIEGCLAGVKVVCALPIDLSTYLYRNLFMYIHTYIYIIFIISVYIVYNVAASHDNDSQFVAVVVVTKQTNVCPQSTWPNSNNNNNNNNAICPKSLF